MAVRTSMPGRIGPYRLQDVIGEGGMGVVYLAHDQEGRPVAIKVLHPGVAADPDARRRLVREFETMRRVRSSFVAEVIDADVTGDMPYVVTRYVAGRTLDQTVRQDGPLRGQALERLAWGLAEGIAAVHDAGVVHRDLKPANVVLSGGTPVLIDFGIAQPPDATRITQTGMFMGTPGYLAPEVVEGQPSEPAADVHSWGSTVAYAATGRPPFGTGPYESIFYRIISGQPDTNGIPAALMPLVSAALSRDPARRPSATQLSAACAVLDLSSPAAMTAPAVGGVLGAGRQAVTLDAVAPAGAVVAGPPTGAPAPGTVMEQPAVLPGKPGGDAVTLIPGPDAVQQRTRQLPGVNGADNFADLLPPVSYPVPAYPLPAGSLSADLSPAGSLPADLAPASLAPASLSPAGLPAVGKGRPGQKDPARPARADGAVDPARAAVFRDRVSRLLSLVTMVIAAAASLLLPVAGTIVSLAIIVLLRAAERSRSGLLKRRTGREARASDVFVAVLTAPWALARSLLATALLAPLALAAAAAAAAVTLMVTRVHPLVVLGGYAAAAFVAFYGLGPGSRPPRRQLALIYGSLTRTRTSATLAAVVFVAAALGTVAVAVSHQHLYWPASPVLPWHWQPLRHFAITVQSVLPHL